MKTNIKKIFLTFVLFILTLLPMADAHAQGGAYFYVGRQFIGTDGQFHFYQVRGAFNTLTNFYYRQLALMPASNLYDVWWVSASDDTTYQDFSTGTYSRDQGIAQASYLMSAYFGTPCNNPNVCTTQANF